MARSNDCVFDKECIHFGALHFKAEAGTTGLFTLCCGQGRAKAVPRIRTPITFKDLLPDRAACELTLRQEHFRDNIRRYNAGMCFASFGGAAVSKENEEKLKGHGPPAYILHGQAYHSIKTLRASEEGKEWNNQLYIFDPEEAADKRVSVMTGLRRDIFVDLHKKLLKLDPDDETAFNPYALQFFALLIGTP